MRAVERGLDGRDLRGWAARAAAPDWVAAGRFLAEYHGVTVARASPARYDPAELIRSRAQRLRRRRRAARRRARAAPAHLRRRVPGHRPGAGRAAAAARRRRRRAGPGRRPGPVDLRLPRRRRVGDPRRRRRASARGAAGARRRAGRVAAAPGRCCSPPSRRVADRLPGRAEQRDCASARVVDPGRGRRSACSAPRARRPPISPACCAARTSTGMPWSRMAVLVRSTAAVLGHAAPGADHGRGAGRRARRGPAARPSSRRSRCCSTCCGAPSILTALSEDAAEATRCSARSAAPTSCTCAGCAGCCASAPVRTRRPLLAPALLDPAGAAVLPEPVRRPVAAGRARSLAAGRARRRPRAVTPRTCCGRCGTRPGWRRGGQRRARPAGRAGAAADRDLDAVVELFDAAARFTDRLPGAGARPVRRTPRGAADSRRRDCRRARPSPTRSPS